MKISRLAIADYQQFKWLDLDLTYREGHPKAGQPLDKVCFIGANGTGKTTLLSLLITRMENYVSNYSFDTRILLSFRSNDSRIDNVIVGGRRFIHDAGSTDERIRRMRETHPQELIDFLEENKIQTVESNIFEETDRLLLYLPTDTHENELLKTSNLPSTNLSEALDLISNKYYYIISLKNFKEFWKLLILHTNERTSNEVEFLNAHQDKTVGELKKKFAEKHPDILEAINKLWSKILDRAGLYFDYEKAKRPFRLSDNLEAYIKLKSNDEVIPYNKLSSGIRDMIFRFGYLKALYFGRDIDWATALIDEPENSLFVDLQYNIIELYEEVCPNTQLFFATHSPIIAAQFHPDERVILEFDEAGYVTASRGVAAEGDDPNDVLVGDFKRQTVLGKVGEEKWQRYVELIHLMENEKDEKKKVEHAKEFMKIGSDYKFGTNVA